MRKGVNNDSQYALAFATAAVTTVGLVVSIAHPPRVIGGFMACFPFLLKRDVTVTRFTVFWSSTTWIGRARADRDVARLFKLYFWRKVNSI